MEDYTAGRIATIKIRQSQIDIQRAQLEDALRSIAADGCDRGLGDGGCNGVAPFDGWMVCPACRAVAALATPDAGAATGAGTGGAG